MFTTYRSLQSIVATIVRYHTSMFTTFQCSPHVICTIYMVATYCSSPHINGRQITSSWTMLDAVWTWGNRTPSQSMSTTKWLTSGLEVSIVNTFSSCSRWDMCYVNLSDVTGTPCLHKHEHNTPSTVNLLCILMVQATWHLEWIPYTAMKLVVHLYTV